MSKAVICLLFIISILAYTGCFSKYIKYPYAENNTTETVIFDNIIKDDYQWMELYDRNYPIFNNWLNAQNEIKENYFRNTDSKIKDRINELSQISVPKVVKINGDTIYYLKCNLYSQDVKLNRINKETKESEVIKDFSNQIIGFSEIIASISKDNKKIAITTLNQDNRFDIYVYNLEDTNLTPVLKIKDVVNYKPVWSNNTLIYIEAENPKKSFIGQRVCAYTISDIHIEKKIIYQNSKNDLFAIIDISEDTSNNKLLISNYSDYSKREYNTYQVDLTKLDNPCLLHKFKRTCSDNLRMAGNDHKNIYYIEHNNNIKGKVYALNKNSKEINLIFNHPDKTICNFNLVKDHVIITFRKTINTVSYLINNTDFEYKKIETPTLGHCQFINNKDDSTIYYTIESIKEPKTLFFTKTCSPEKSELVFRLTSLNEMGYNPDDINSEGHSIITKDGRRINFSVTYKGNLKKDGNNPLIISINPFNLNSENTLFYFSRVLFIEEGYIWVERSPEDMEKNATLEHKIIDIEDAINYLIENKYTQNQNIILKGNGYGASLIGVIMNNNPNICKSAVLTNGIFDYVQHKNIDKHNIHMSSMFDYKTNQEFEKLYKISPYHQILTSKSYPSVFIGFDGYQTCNPAHTYKYAAKLQMRTKAKNPIIVYNPYVNSSEDNLTIKNLETYIYHKAFFIFSQMKRESIL